MYIEFFIPKKTVFSPLKNTFQNGFDFFLPYFYANFQCGRYNIFKKMLNLFSAHENIKEQASKVAHNWPQTSTARLSKPAQNWFIML
jgi:hypothetical protein